MSRDLVTYYGQTTRIDSLVGKYGPYLEQLDRETKLLLRMTLAHYAFMQQFCKPDDYSVLEALQDALFVRFICEEMPRILPEVCAFLEGLTIDETESILDALQHQIHWGNAQTLVNQ